MVNGVVVPSPIAVLRTIFLFCIEEPPQVYVLHIELASVHSSPLLYLSNGVPVTG